MGRILGPETLTTGTSTCIYNICFIMASNRGPSFVTEKYAAREYSDTTGRHLSETSHKCDSAAAQYKEESCAPAVLSVLVLLRQHASWVGLKIMRKLSGGMLNDVYLCCTNDGNQLVLKVTALLRLGESSECLHN